MHTAINAVLGLAVFYDGPSWQQCIFLEVCAVGDVLAVPRVTKESFPGPSHLPA